MCEKTVEQFLEKYPYHFVLNTGNTNLLERLHHLAMHQEMIEVSSGEYLLFFNDDRAMNACLRKVESLLKELDSSLAFF